MTKGEKRRARKLAQANGEPLAGNLVLNADRDQGSSEWSPENTRAGAKARENWAARYDEYMCPRRRRRSMRVIPSAILRDAGTASKRYEEADAEMRRHHPKPPDKVVREWNAARRAAEAASQIVLNPS